MRTHYVCHATLVIEASGTTIVCDPWYNGPAYCGQWHVFPKPVDTGLLDRADVILLSHGHEDHLHEPTLGLMPKNARIFFPYSWYGGIREFARSLGFADVSEAVTGRRYHLAPATTVTYIANNLDSIMVIESDGEVLVNLSDALHAYHPNVIDAFVRELKKRWPRIDVLFCGYGGASYFPNTIHVDGKDDVEIARAREQMFAHNFCRIVRELQPAVAVPFAADFVLLDDHQRWINDVRFPSAKMEEYYREHFERDTSIRIHAMYPGDRLEGRRLIQASPYRAELRQGCLHHLIDAQIARRRTTFHLMEIDAALLQGEIRRNLLARRVLFRPSTLENVRYTVRVSDVARDGCYNIAFEEGEPGVRRSEEPDARSILVLDTSSTILRRSFASDWGGDAITIGYGVDISVRDVSILEEKLDTVCVRLLTNHPATTRHMKSDPIRAAKFLLTNPVTGRWAVRQITRPERYVQEPVERKHWLTRTKCEICRICDLPMLDADFSASIAAGK